MRFVAIDVETANPSYHSICQIGVVLIEDGREVAAESVFVDPREEFGEWQIRVHGIRPDQVVGSPCFSEHHSWLRSWTEGQTVISHTHFDRAAIGQACGHHQLAPIVCDWVDSKRIAMAAWPGRSSYRLGDLASALGITFRAHDALEDARACAQIVQRALDEGHSLSARGEPGNSRSRGRWEADVRRTGDGDGALLGETIVFTGNLSMGKERAADMAAEAGGDVIPNVTKKMTMLVVGERDLQPGWQLKSGKHRKVEELIAKGHDIQIIGEPDFLALAAITT